MSRSARGWSPARWPGPPSWAARRCRSSSATRAAGRLGRPARRGPRVPGRHRRARRPGVHPRAVPREPRLPDPVDVRAVGGLGRAQPPPRGRDRRRGGGRAHRIVRRPDRPAEGGAYAAALRQVRDGLLPLLDALGERRPVAAARADRRAGSLAVRRRRGPRAVPRRARPPPAGRDLPRHLPRLRRRRAARRPRRHHGDRGPDRGDRRGGPAAAGPRQRLDGRARRLQGPAPEDRAGPHRRGRLRGAVRAPGDGRGAVRPGDPRLARARQRRHPAAQELRERAVA